MFKLSPCDSMCLPRLFGAAPQRLAIAKPDSVRVKFTRDSGCEEKISTAS